MSVALVLNVLPNLLPAKDYVQTGALLGGLFTAIASRGNNNVKTPFEDVAHGAVRGALVPVAVNVAYVVTETALAILNNLVNFAYDLVGPFVFEVSAGLLANPPLAGLVALAAAGVFYLHRQNNAPAPKAAPSGAAPAAV